MFFLSLSPIFININEPLIVAVMCMYYVHAYIASASCRRKLKPSFNRQHLQSTNIIMIMHCQQTNMQVQTLKTT